MGFYWSYSYLSCPFLCALGVGIQAKLGFKTVHNVSTAYRIAGNFHKVQIFAIFATHDENAKIRTMK